MSLERNDAYLAGLVRELCKLPAETPWLEFKHNNADPQQIGEYLSALSNAAALDGKGSAYLVWGVDDGSHAIVGTSFKPHAAKKGLISKMLQLAPKSSSFWQGCRNPVTWM